MVSSTSPHPLARKAALASGLLLMLHYVVQLAYGLRTGRALFENFNGSLWAYAGGVAFFAFYCALPVALFLVALSYWRQSRPMFILSMVPLALALVAGLAGLGTVVLLTGTSTAARVMNIVGPIGILSQFAGAILVGGTAIALRSIPRSTAMMVLLFGLLTMPTAFLIAALLRSSVAPWAWSEVHFFLAGILWLAISRGLKSRERRMVVV